MSRNKKNKMFSGDQQKDKNLVLELSDEIQKD